MYINKGILTFRTKTFCKFESSEMFLPRHTSKLLTSKTFKLVKFGWQTLKEISKFCIIWYPLKSFVLLLHQRNHYNLKVFWSFTKFVSSQVNIKVGKNKNLWPTYNLKSEYIQIEKVESKLNVEEDANSISTPKFISLTIKLCSMYLKVVSNWYHSIKTFLTLLLKFKTFIKRIQFRTSLRRTIKLWKVLSQSFNELLQQVWMDLGSLLLFQNKCIYDI